MAGSGLIWISANYGFMHLSLRTFTGFKTWLGLNLIWFNWLIRKIRTVRNITFRLTTTYTLHHKNAVMCTGSRTIPLFQNETSKTEKPNHIHVWSCIELLFDFVNDALMKLCFLNTNIQSWPLHTHTDTHTNNTETLVHWANSYALGSQLCHLETF